MWLASNRLGATWVPINTEMRSVTLRGIVQAADPKAVIIDSELWTELQPLDVIGLDSVYVNEISTGGSNVRELSTLLGPASTVTTPAEVNPGATSAFLYTSGTTGKSKPCILSHEFFLLQAEAIIGSLGLHGDDVLYCPFPLFHIDATALTVMPAILLGATAALSVRFSASQFWDEIRASEATVFNFMGATLALTYKQPQIPSDRDHSIRLAWGVHFRTSSRSIRSVSVTVSPPFTEVRRLEYPCLRTPRSRWYPGLAGAYEKGTQPASWEAREKQCHEMYLVICY